MNGKLKKLKKQMLFAKEAFNNREKNNKISSRYAKLLYDAYRGRLTLNEALSKLIALHLRRHYQLSGDKSYQEALREISAFLAETGDFEHTLNFYLRNIRSSEANFTNEQSISETIVDSYQKKGAYGVILVIENAYPEYNNYKKANKLLDVGKMLKLKFKHPNVRTEFAKIALQLDKSEAIYRGACWSMLSENNNDDAMCVFAQLQHHYGDHISDMGLYKKLRDEVILRCGFDNVNRAVKHQKNAGLFGSEIVADNKMDFFGLTDKDLQLQVFEDLLRQSNGDSLVQKIKADEYLDNKAKARLALVAAKSARAYEDIQYEKFKMDTLALTDYAFSLDKSESVLRNAYFAYQRINEYEKSKQVIALLKELAGTNPSQQQKKLLWSTPEHLASISTQLPNKAQHQAYKPKRGFVYYVIHNSLPYSSGGYATRGHGLLTALRQRGLDIEAVTRPGYPHDISNISVDQISLKDEVDGATYKRLLYPSRRDYSNYEYMLKATEAYMEIFMEDRPALVMAASNHLCALPAMFAARQLGVPFIYEIRGYWEVTRISKYPEFEQNPMFEVEKSLEALLAKNADHIFTLTQGMINEMLSRGVDISNKVTLLPNSCNIEIFEPQNKDMSLLQKYNIPQDVPVIGYVGTFVSYEGLDDLATACAALKTQGYEFRLMLVGNENATGQGGGSITEQVQKIAEQNDFSDWLIMPGRIPFEEVESHYSLIDIAPFPRKAWPVCEIVPPMKTLEALAMKKAVIVSSNLALTEMIEHDVNGRVFERGNVQDFIEQLKYMLDNKDKWPIYGEKGREFVKNERTWQQTADKAYAVIESFVY